MLSRGTIGKKIKENRELKNITQQDMVEYLKEKQISMSRETLSKIENGNRSVSALELQAITEIFQINIEQILKDEDDDNLITLFRKNTNLEEESLKEIENIQDIIVSFINQKKIYNRAY